MVTEYFNLTPQSTGAERWDIVGDRKLVMPAAFRAAPRELPEKLEMAHSALFRISTLGKEVKKQTVELLRTIHDEGKNGDWITAQNTHALHVLLSLNLIERNPNEWGQFGCTGNGDITLELINRDLLNTSVKSKA